MIKRIEEAVAKSLNDMFETEAFQNTMKAIEEDDNYKFKVVVTTEGVDRDGEVIKADGIEIQRYLKNPVVLVNHEYKIESIVGKTISIYQNEAWETIAEGIFAKGTEKADICRTLYNQGFIKTVSIGFIAKQRASTDRNVITNAEMLEFSFVAVPANPEALSLDGKMLQKGIELWIIKEVQTVSVTAEEIKAGDMITYRRREVITTEDGRVIENVYPNFKDLPRMGKVIQKLSKNEEILTWSDEIVVAKPENPVLTIHDYIRSEDWPKTITQNIFLRKFNDLIIEKIVSQKEFDEMTVKYCNENEIDIKDVVHIMSEIKESFSEMKDQLKSLADDKAEEKSLYKLRELGKELQKGLSAFNQEAKAQK